MRTNLSKHLVYFISFVCFIIWSFSFLLALRWVNKPFSGFLFYDNLVISEVLIDSEQKPADTDEVPRIISDRVIAVNGERVNSPSDVYNIVNRYNTDFPLDYSIIRGEKIFEYTVPVSTFHIGNVIFVFAIVYFCGLVFFVTGISVYFLRPNLTTSKIFFLLSSSLGLWLVTCFDSQTTHVFDKISDLGFSIAPTFAIYLAAVFPTERKLTFRHYLLLSLLMVFSVSIFCLSTIMGSDHANWFTLREVMWAYAFIGAAVIAGSTLITYIKSTNILYKQRAQIVFTGSVFGLIIPLFVVISSRLLHFHVPMGMLMILLMVFPISIAYSVLKHKLFDLNVIIRRALVYGLLTGALGSIIAILIISFNLILAKHGGWKNPIFFIVLSAFLAVALNPLQNKIQAIIDLIFFRKKYDYRKTVEDISFAMTSILNPEDIYRKIVETIENTIFAKNIILLFYDENQKAYRPYVAKNQDDKNRLFLDEDNILIEMIKDFKSEIFIEDIYIDDRLKNNVEQLQQAFDRFESALFMPMFVKEKLIGIISLGVKKSELTYTSEDLELLRTLANQSSVAIENALAFRLVEDYAKKLEDTNIELRETQTQLIQSEKMSAIGQLAAGIAHEIRNPLNIIEGARYYLSHMLSETEKSESVTEYLSYIKQEVERTNNLISNLLKFSKSETPSYELVDINTTLDNTLTLLKKQLSDGSVRGIKQFDNELPSILGDPNQLWQVFVNIIMNAIQAMPEGGDLTINTSTCDNNTISVSFKDTGVGMDKDVMKKIFDPFFTKKDTGTGLGLSISYSIIESHKGAIKVDSEKGVGTQFIIELPVGKMEKIGQLKDKYTL